jgi:hypothetical protein
MKKFILLCLFFALANSWAESNKDAGYKALMEKDYATAINILMPFAEAGDTTEQFNLGMWFYEGLGVQQDYAEAARWYRLAADQGDALAKYNLGLMYANGEGVIQDYREAFTLFRSSAQYDCTICQVTLGSSYEQGIGTAKDLVLAYVWYNVAAADTNKYRMQYQKKAFAKRNYLASHLTRDEITRGQELSRLCFASNLKQCGETNASIHQADPIIPGSTKNNRSGARIQNEKYLADPSGIEAALEIGPVYLILKAAVATGLFFIVTIGLLKSTRSTPASFGRWIGAYFGSIAIVFMKPYSTFPNLSEFFATASTLFLMLFTIGFVVGLIWRKFKPVPLLASVQHGP